MNEELLKAWVHNVMQNPIDDDQLAHAQATKELIDKLAKAREALLSIESRTFQWVMTKDNAADLLLVLRPIKEKCREVLKEIE